MSLIYKALFILSVLLFSVVQTEALGAIENTDNYGSENDDFGRNGQPIPDPTEKTPLDTRVGTKIHEKAGKGEWVVAPIPNYDPSQGWGLVLMAQKIFAHGEGVKPSMAVGAIFGTEKKSYGGVAGYIGRMNEDALRFNIFGGYAKVNSDFYGVGKDASERDLSVLLEQQYTFMTAQLLPRFSRGYYLGPTLMFSDVKNAFNIGGLPPNIDASSRMTSQTWVPGLKFQFDGRSNTFYPTDGIYTNLQIQFYDERFGGGYTFQRYKANYNQYIGIFDEDVLAVRASLQANVGDVPFYDMAMFGMGPDLRGFKAGKYRDKVLWATQGEYRHRFTDHWGAVVFGGLGDVVSSIADMTLKDVLWSGGAGARYRLGKENPVDFSVDIAHGDDWVWYFSVNQAF